MYLGNDYKIMNDEAEWIEVDFETFQSMRSDLGKQLDNLYIRVGLNSEDTRWDGILLYDHSSGNIPYFKYEVKGEYRHFYYNKEIINA